jgi:hypothetical protein
VAGIEWTAYEEKVLIDGKDLSTKELQELLPDRSRSSITSRLKYLGFAKPVGHRKYNIDMNFFSVPNIINSYFAGFIAADGCITPKKHLVSFGLKADDGYILEELVKHCGFEGEVSYPIHNDYKKATLFLWGVKQWHEDLEKYYNIIPRKSLTLQPPSITDEGHIKAFIRGYIDGDGGIYTESGLNTWIIRLRGTYEMLFWISRYFNRMVPDTRVNPAELYLDKIWSYRVSGKRSIKILSKLLEVDTPYLTRKWQPIIDHLNNLPLI